MEWNEKEIIKELVKEFGKEFKEEIESTLNLEIGRYSGWGDAGSVVVNGVEYNIIRDEDEAIKIALDIVRQDLEDEPELFDQNWLSNFIYITDVDKRMLIADEESVIREGVKEEAESEEFETNKEKKEWIKNEVNGRLEDFIDGLDNPIEYFVEEVGIYSLEDLMKQPWIQINIDEATEDAVRIDGFARYLSLYDGSYETTKDGLVYFKE